MSACSTALTRRRRLVASPTQPPDSPPPQPEMPTPWERSISQPHTSYLSIRKGKKDEDKLSMVEQLMLLAVYMVGLNRVGKIKIVLIRFKTSKI